MTPTTQESELDLSDYLRILRKRWRWALAAFCTVVAAAVAFTLLQPDSYTAETRVLVGQSEAESVVTNESQNTSFLTRTLANEISLIEGDSVERRVEAELGSVPKVSVAAEGVSDVLRIQAVSGTAEEAAEAANAYATAYVREKQERSAAEITAATDKFNSDLEQLGEARSELRLPVVQLQTRLVGAVTDQRRAQLQQQIDLEEYRIAPQLNLLDARINAVAKAVTDLELSGAFAATGSAVVVEAAIPPSSPSNTPLSRSIALGVVAGTIVAIAAALFAHTLDRNVNTADDVRQLTNLPVLGSVPLSDDVERPSLDLQTLERPESPVGDAYHRVRTALQFSFLSRDIRSVLITSANPAEGKTTTSINLAGALAAIGSRVILADFDFRRPRLHQIFDIEMIPGLSDHLLEGTPLHELAFTVASANNSLVVLPSGSTPPSPGDLVSTPAFADLVRLVEKEGDIAVFDAPPVLPVSDAVTLSRLVDAVIVTARAGSTHRDDLRRTVETLQQVGAEIAGIVLVGADSPDQYYRYKSDSGKIAKN
jgi:capsular exopolysaccharide synthesis family protein